MGGIQSSGFTRKKSPGNTGIATDTVKQYAQKTHERHIMGGEINDQISLVQTALETQELERTPLTKKKPKNLRKVRRGGSRRNLPRTAIGHGF